MYFIGFAASASVVLTCFVSNLIFHEGTIDTMFVIGASVVCSSAYVYSLKPSSDPSLASTTSTDKLSSNVGSTQILEEKEGLLAESEMTNSITARGSRDKL